MNSMSQSTTSDLLNVIPQIMPSTRVFEYLCKMYITTQKKCSDLVFANQR